jgi:translocation and assembly module TamA
MDRILGSGRRAKWFKNVGYCKYILRHFSSNYLLVILGVACGLLLRCAVCSAGGEWVRIEGVNDDALLAELRSATGLSRMNDTNTFTDAWLLQKAKKDADALLEVLRAAGLHEATVMADVQQDAAGRFVLFSVQAGAVFAFDRPELIFIRALAPSLSAVIQDTLSVKPGNPAHSADIIDSEKRMLSRLRDSGYPFPKITDRKVIIDRNERAVHVKYSVDPGDACRFGPITVEGLEHVSESVILAELPWKTGDEYTQILMETARRRILKTGLFSMVDIDTMPSTTQSAQASVHIRVVERKPRSVSLGLEYRTEEGPGLHTMWEHRNLRGIGHRLALQGDLSPVLQGFSAKYEIPRFKNPDQTLALTFKAVNDTPTAYDSHAVDTALWLERQYGEPLTVGAGLSVRYSRVKQQDSYDDFLLGSLPLQAVLDKRNNHLNPTAGFRTALRGEPYIDLTGSSNCFLKSDWSLTGMQSLAGSDDWVLAARLKLGIISGEDLAHIPADIRFYAGGGGSIRGFGYQRAGELDKDDAPTGGRSLAEWTIEMRKTITERIGMAAFVDGGRAFSGQYPDFSEPIFWGSGIGLRYYTPVGPIRFDVAAPINPRAHVDAAIQFYVSVGQAF